MSDNKSQTQSKVMERIAFIAVVVFALGISYAIHITQKTVRAVQENHYQSSEEVMADLSNATTSTAEEPSTATSSSEVNDTGSRVNETPF